MVGGLFFVPFFRSPYWKMSNFIVVQALSFHARASEGSVFPSHVLGSLAMAERTAPPPFCPFLGGLSLAKTFRAGADLFFPNQVFFVYSSVFSSSRLPTYCNIGKSLSAYVC